MRCTLLKPGALSWQRYKEVTVVFVALKWDLHLTQNCAPESQVCNSRGEKKKIQYFPWFCNIACKPVVL